MKAVKRRLESFAFYDHTGIEAHLTRMAQKGWLPEKIGRHIWTYRKIQPKRLIFSVCYFPEATEFDPEPSEKQETFYDFCAHTGWTLAASNAQLQIFYNERENPVPIETDPALEIKAIGKAAAMSFLFPRFVLLAAVLMCGVLLVQEYLDDPVDTLCSLFKLYCLAAAPLILTLLAVDLGGYFLWRRRALKAAAQGEFLDTKSHPVFHKAVYAFLLAGLVLSYTDTMLRFPFPFSIIAALLPVCWLGILALLLGVRRFLKRKKASADTNFMVTYGVSQVLGVFILGMVPVLAFVAGRADTWRSSPPDALPLTLAELVQMPEGEDYRWDMRSSGSFLLGYVNTRQRVQADGGEETDGIWLDYSILSVKLPALYDLCRDDRLYRYDTRNNDRVPEGEKMWYEPSDPAPWGAEAAYQRYHQKYGLRSEFLLCYQGRFVEISFDDDWQLSREQMKLVGERLGG